ncbi:MAG TPA: N-acetylmuramoyl-L-alanine amidase, partial [Desulfurivibrio alkaliphilus]|nr:N-acetylmuramoyl-L-alanine amidase [Desulfurivibrio alkaliphilus]
PGAPTAALSLAQQLGLGVRRVVIDPGHGGRDPGAISPSGIMEKDVTLRVAKLLATALKQRLGSEVILTRDRDIFLPLEERTAIANSRDADLFISIHVNSAPSRGARGVETYILDMVASDDEAMRTAARENASSARSFSDLQNIVHQLLNNAKLQESVHLANMVHETVVESLRQTYGGRVNDRGIRRAPFVVLIGARMPALLVEVGFISNPEEERLLTDEQYLNQLAASIAEGVRQYATNLNTASR